MPDFETAVTGLRAWANSHNNNVRAAVELLIWHETWLRRGSFTRSCLRFLGGGEVVINWPSARRFSDQVTAGGLDAPRASTSEAAILDLAVTLGEDRFRLGNMGSAHRKAIVEAVTRAVGLNDA